MSSFLPSGVAPISTSMHSLWSSIRACRKTPSAHTYTYRRADRSRFCQRSYSPCHAAVSLEITAGDRFGASLPRSAASASKLFVRRAHSGRIAEVNRIRSPALAAQRSRIFTRATSTGPIPVWIVRALYRSNPKSHASHISELALGDVHLVGTQSLGEAATREVDNSPRQFPRSHRSS